MAKADAVIEPIASHTHRTTKIQFNAWTRKTQTISRRNDFGQNHGCRFKCFYLVLTISALGLVLDNKNAQSAARAKHRNTEE
ncbi:hypothetical protein D9M70_589240 [compost metagenome]